MGAVESEPYARRKLSGARVEESGTDLLAVPANDGGGVGLAHARDQRSSFARDAGLFARDRFQRRAERGDMIKVDGDDRGDHRLDGVGGVQPSAEADLEDCRLNVDVLKGAKRGSGHDLEERRVRGEHAAREATLARIANPVEHAMQLGGGDVVARDPDPLVRTHEMRRRVEPRAVTRGQKHRVHHRGNRALAVRSADEHRPKAALGVIQQLKKRADAFQSEFDTMGLQAVQPSDRIVCHGISRIVPRVIITRR
jgi:hypothetical protein